MHRKGQTSVWKLQLGENGAKMKKILGEKSSRVESATLAATEVTPDVSTNSQDYPNNQRKPTLQQPQRNPQQNQRRNQ